MSAKYNRLFESVAKRSLFFVVVLLSMLVTHVSPITERSAKKIEGNYSLRKDKKTTS